MKPRDIALLTGILLLAGALGALMLGQGGPAPVEPMPGGPPPVAEPPQGPTAAEAVGTEDPPARPEKVEAAPVRETLNTEGWTSGLIVGDIMLSTRVIGQLESITVTVQESRNPIDASGDFVRPWSRTIPVEFGPGTPTFEVRDVPFSAYGYSVRCFSPGLNGSEQVVAVTEKDPYQQVVLGISPGAPFSILLRDQLQGPMSDMTVAMVPAGAPPGRPTYRGTSDNYGSLVFEDVLAGDYQIFVGNVEQPVVEPVAATVQPPGRTFVRGAPVRGQFRQIEVPRGESLAITVVGPNNWGLEGATVKLLATDRVKHMMLMGHTDRNGRYTFPHLVPGSYQIDVFKQNWGRRAKTVRIEEGVPPSDLQFMLNPIR